MEITLFAVSKCLYNNTPNNRSGCMVKGLMKSESGHVEYTQGQPFGTTPANLSEIQAAHMALACVMNKYKQLPIKLMTNGHYVTRMLAKKGDKYASEPAKHADKISRFRRLAEQFPNLQVEYSKDGEVFGDLLDRAAEIAETQKKVLGKSESYGL